jgi:hypothetical protein
LTLAAAHRSKQPLEHSALNCPPNKPRATPITAGVGIDIPIRLDATLQAGPASNARNIRPDQVSGVRGYGNESRRMGAAKQCASMLALKHRMQMDDRSPGRNVGSCPRREGTARRNLPAPHEGPPYFPSWWQGLEARWPGSLHCRGPKWGAIIGRHQAKSGRVKRSIPGT